jgi:hypothetical protein
MIKEIPMLFSAPMVQAELDGRKTMTRRLKGLEQINKAPDKWNYIDVDSPFKPADIFWFESKGNRISMKCPFGMPGDIFYVREEHYRFGAWIEKEGEYTKGGRQKWMFVGQTEEILFEAPAEFRKGRHHKDPYTSAWHKRLARFMPKSAARIWLQKTATKVERACEISREDAIAEGLACITKDGGRNYKYGIPDLDGCPGNDDHGWHWQEWQTDPIEAFKKLWCKINGIETWNDWVWANSFKVLSTTGKPDLNTLKAIHNGK